MKGYRTYIAAAIVAVVGVLQGLDWVSIVQNPKAFGWSTVGLAAIMAIFRSVTNTPPAASV